MQGARPVAAVFRAHSPLSHLGTDGSGSEPTTTAVAPISASNSRRLRSRPITVSPSPCLASEKSACLSFSTRVNSQELHEKPAFPIFFIFGLTCSIGAYTLTAMQRFRPDPTFLACRGCACWRLRQASRAVTRHYERALRGRGLRATQFSLLALLTQTGPLTVSELAAKLGVERTTLTRNLRPLDATRFLNTMTTETDQPVRRLSLTPAGPPAAAKAQSAWHPA